MLKNGNARVLPRSKYFSLAVTSLGVLLLNIDLFVMNVALPTIVKTLNAPLSTVSWAITAYTLMIGIFPASAGKLSDIFGEKKLYLAGITLFTVASFACGISPNVFLLILFRALQGLGAATMIPGTLSILIHAYPEKQRGLAIGLNGGIGGIGIVAGPILGGLLVHGDNWRWIFFVNVPLGIVTILLTLLFVNEQQISQASKKIDWKGLIILSIGLLFILLSFTQAEKSGLHSDSIFFLVAGLALLFLFIRLERRVSEPLIDLTLFRSIYFTLPCISMLLFSASLFGSQPYWSMFFQNFWGFSPFWGGLAFLPATCLIALLTPVAGIIGQKSGNRLRYVVMFGALITSISFIYAADINTESSYITVLLPSLLIRGIGIPFLVSSTSLMMMNSVPSNKSGLAAGVLNMSRNVGTSLGVAVLGLLFASDTGRTLSSLSKEFPGGDLPKAKELAAQFSVIKNSTAAPFAETAIISGFGHLALFCALALIPVFLSALTLRKRRKKTKLVTS